MFRKRHFLDVIFFLRLFHFPRCVFEGAALVSGELAAVLPSTPACHQLISTAVRRLRCHPAGRRCCFPETILVPTKSPAFSSIPCHPADACPGRILPALSLSACASPPPQQSNPPHPRAPLHLCSQPPFIHCIQFFDFSPTHLICSPPLRTWSGAATQDTNEHSTVREAGKLVDQPLALLPYLLYCALLLHLLFGFSCSSSFFCSRILPWSLVSQLLHSEARHTSLIACLCHDWHCSGVWSC